MLSKVYEIDLRCETHDDKKYRWYVRSQNYLKECITEQYLNKEVVRYCMEYITAGNKGIYNRGLDIVIGEGIKRAYPSANGKIYILFTSQYQQARMWVVNKANVNTN